MPTYTPIALPVSLDATDCKIDGVRWIKKSVHINVKMRGGAAVRVAAKDCIAMRHIDGAAINDPEQSPHVGIIPRHLLYEMKDSWFLQATLSAQHSSYATAKHYRVIVLHESVDIIALSPPIVSELSM